MLLSPGQTFGATIGIWPAALLVVLAPGLSGGRLLLAAGMIAVWAFIANSNVAVVSAESVNLAASLSGHRSTIAFRSLVRAEVVPETMEQTQPGMVVVLVTADGRRTIRNTKASQRSWRAGLGQTRRFVRLLEGAGVPVSTPD